MRRASTSSSATARAPGGTSGASNSINGTPNGPISRTIAITSTQAASYAFNAVPPVIAAAPGEEISRGVVPDWCVAVYATRPRTYPGGEFGLPCVLVVKRLEEGERHDKAKLNDILRDHGAAT